MSEIENTSRKHKLGIIKDIMMIALPLILFVIVMNRVADVSTSVDDKVVEQSESIEAIRLEAMNDIQVRVGQEIYVPAYSTLKSIKGAKGIELSITLSIRNTDPQHKITVNSVDFYNSSGEKYRRFITEPIVIRPMETIEFYVPELDKFGGSGANFYVVWVSDVLVNEPIVEAIMLGPAPHGYSLVSPGRVVKSKR